MTTSTANGIYRRLRLVAGLALIAAGIPLYFLPLPLGLLLLVPGFYLAVGASAWARRRLRRLVGDCRGLGILQRPLSAVVKSCRKAVNNKS